jgi:Taurine catabolism dioxygenase TauD, TfdA family
MLFPVSLLSRGGDTQYVNMHQAYDDLSAATRERTDGLEAVHVYLSKYSPRALRPLSEDSARQVPPPGIHPLVRTHPENGRKALYLNPVRIEGDRRHGGRGSARPRRRADDACNPEEIRIPPPMALRRLCDLGQPAASSTRPTRITT